MHNGRFCITPEYPNGTYAYFATVDENWNSTYPYVVGPTFYGEKENRKVNNVNEETVIYISTVAVSDIEFKKLVVNVYPNPTVDLIGIQLSGLVNDDNRVDLLDLNGQIIATTKISSGTTITYFDVETIYSGIYLIALSNGDNIKTTKVIIGD